MKNEELKTKFITCSECESRVAANILGSSSIWDDDTDIQVNVYLLQCPVCKIPLCGTSESEPEGVIRNGTETWELVESLVLERVWPWPKKQLYGIPPQVKKSLEEAERCLEANANFACSVMCGRTLEEICMDFGLENKSLSENLQELRVRGIIDGKLFEWGETLRKMRNIGAHANKGHISKQDARDVFDFTIAICEYVYILTSQYEKFKTRQSKIEISKVPNIVPTETPQSNR